ncbi:MAG: hypothetical protein ACAF41_05030 [Leptolyngbya sp. BL-A-14]
MPNANASWLFGKRLEAERSPSLFTESDLEAKAPARLVQLLTAHKFPTLAASR